MELGSFSFEGVGGEVGVVEFGVMGEEVDGDLVDCYGDKLDEAEEKGAGGEGG